MVVIRERFLRKHNYLTDMLVMLHKNRKAFSLNGAHRLINKLQKPNLLCIALQQALVMIIYALYRFVYTFAESDHDGFYEIFQIWDTWAKQ